MGQQQLIKVLRREVSSKNSLDVASSTTIWTQTSHAKSLIMSKKDIAPPLQALPLIGAQWNWKAQFLEFQDSVEEKKKALECPVCLETAQIPIYMCQNCHLVCRDCLPKLKECPECRDKYSKPVMKHRFAEKMVEEKTKIEQKIKDVLENEGR